MNYAKWLVEVPSEITNDPIWKLEVYRLGLFAGDIGWEDVQFLAKKPLMLKVADQLHRAIDSISVNLTEGYSRSKGPDRARKPRVVLQIPSCTQTRSSQTPNGTNNPYRQHVNPDDSSSTQTRYPRRTSRVQCTIIRVLARFGYTFPVKHLSSFIFPQLTNTNIFGESTMSFEKSSGSPHHFLSQLAGSWTGTSKLWLEPGKLADESPVLGTITLVLEGRFAIYLYQGSIEGEPQHGMFTFGYNTVTDQYEASWVDSFHNNTAIMFCVGSATDHGFSVLGSYPDPSGGPDWGWRTELQLLDKDHLIITAYNIHPEYGEAKATEATLTRVKKS